MFKTLFKNPIFKIANSACAKTVSKYRLYALVNNNNNNVVKEWKMVNFRACLYGGGGPHVGEVSRLGGVTRLSIKSLILIWSRLHDGWGNPPHVTSPTWGPLPPCKQALKLGEKNVKMN